MIAETRIDAIWSYQKTSVLLGDAYEK